MNNPATAEAILGALSKSNTPLTAEGIAKSLNTFRNKINVPLNQLLKEKRIITESNGSGAPAFQIAEGASAQFELSQAPAEPAKTAPKTAASAKPAAATKPAKNQKVVNISQGARPKEKTAAASAPAMAVTDTVDAKTLILQLLNGKPRQEEEFASIEGHQAIIGDLIADQFVEKLDMFGEQVFRFTTEGKAQYPKSYFEGMPAPVIAAPAQSTVPAASSAPATAEAPAKAKRGRPSNAELARRAAEAAKGSDVAANAGQQATSVAATEKPAAKAVKPAKVTKPAKASKPKAAKPAAVASVDGKPKRGRPSNEEKARRAAEAALQGGQVTTTAAPAPAVTKAAAKPKASPAPAAEIKPAVNQPSLGQFFKGEDMLEFTRLISKVVDEQRQVVRSENESFRKDVVELAKSMAELSTNMHLISERILKTFSS